MYEPKQNTQAMQEIFPNPTPMTKAEIAAEIGISLSTFRRKLKKENISLPRGLIYPKDFYDILIIFYPKDMIKHLQDAE